MSGERWVAFTSTSKLKKVWKRQQGNKNIQLRVIPRLDIGQKKGRIFIDKKMAARVKELTSKNRNDVLLKEVTFWISSSSFRV